MVVMVAFTLLVGLAFVSHWAVAAITQARAQNIADAVALAAVSGDEVAVSAVVQAQPANIREQLVIHTQSNSAPGTNFSPELSSDSVLVTVQLANQSAHAAATAH